MNRNEYRRAFIMLRPALPGYGGHARLERRTLTGSMYFIVNAPQEEGPLTAALAGQRDGVYYAAGIGRLARDRRGQLTLAYGFDPRSIDSRPLEAYAWVVVARPDGAVALTGNVEGSRPMDPDALRQAVRALVAPEPAPAFDLPEPGEAEPQPPAEPAPPEPKPTPEEPDDIRIYTGSRARAAAGAPAAETAPREELPVAEAATAREEPPVAEIAPAREEPPAAEAATAREEPPVAEVATAREEPDAARTAAKQLGLDITRPWPGGAEPLRRLFATQAAAEDAPEDGFTYVRASMPRGSGYGDCLAGLKAGEGRPVAIRYALPGRYSPEPPAGMEDYIWTGAGGEGYWVLEETP